MGLSTQEEFILFSLGRCHAEANRRFGARPLSLNLSKAAFIDLAKHIGMVEKGERAMYRNLETLEQKKLISYRNKALILTDRGFAKYAMLLDELEPYVAVSRLLESLDVVKFAKKGKTVLSN